MDISRISFSFESKGMAAETFQVVRFGSDEEISKPFEFDVTLMSKQVDLDMDGVMDNLAVFTIVRGEERVAFSGVLKHFDFLKTGQGCCFYRAILVPKLWWLTQVHKSQIFLDKTVPEIIEQILKEGGLSSLDYELRLRGSYEPREYVCQYRESHFNFLSRWLEREGMYYFFEHGSSGSKLVITDNLGAHAASRQASCVYAPESGLEDERAGDAISEFVCRKSLTPKSVAMKDYNYRKPTTDVAGKASVDDDGKGSVSLFGENCKTPAEASRLASVRAEELKCRADVVLGSGTACFLKAGHTFVLTGHPRKEFNRKYLVATAKHRGDQTEALTASVGKQPGMDARTPHYTVEFTAILSDAQYRPRRTVKRPSIRGTMNAVIDASGSGENAELDEQGRYKVVLPFDESGKSGGKASHWLRMMQPYAGKDHGLHFPLHKGAEVLLAFIDGDPDRPVIAGAVPNPDNPSVVQDKNLTQSLIQTAGQNKLLFEDQDGSQRVLIKTPTNSTFVRLGTSDSKEEEKEEESGFLYHTEGKYIADIGSDMSWKVLGNEIEMTVGTKEGLTVGAATEMTAGASTEITVGQSTELFLGAKIEAKKGKSVEIGELGRVGISPEEELIGVKKVGIKAGAVGKLPSAGAALTAAMSTVASMTAAVAAGSALKKPSKVEIPAIAAPVASILTILTTTLEILFLKEKNPGTFSSTIELDDAAIAMESRKVQIEAKGNIEAKAGDSVTVKAKKKVELISDQNDVSLQAKKNISLAAQEEVSLLGKTMVVSCTKDITLESSAGPVGLSAKEITLQNKQPGGTVTLKTDNFKWKPVAAGQFDAGGVLKIDPTGQVKIG